MQNAEVIKFPAPECRLSHGCYQWDGNGGKSWCWLMDQHPFNTKVSILLPDSPTLPGDLRELLTEDTQYYRVSQLPLHELCAPAFLQAFLSKGKVFALSCDTRLDLDNTAAITPDGVLRLVLDRYTYHQQCLSGVLSAHILRTPPQKFVVEVDLKSKDFHPGRKQYQRVLDAFTQMSLAFTFWLMWLPDDRDTCPSSIAKYFHDLGYSVGQCEATLRWDTEMEVLMPFAGLPNEVEEHTEEQEDTRAEPEDLLEWIGCQMVGVKLGDVESLLSSVVQPKHGTPVRNLCRVDCCGFFPPSFIHLLLQHLRSWLQPRNTAAVPWVSLAVHGHPDSPVSWGRQEHSFHTNGDNLYVMVVMRDGLHAYQLQGPAKPQRLYVKTNKTK